MRMSHRPPVLAVHNPHRDRLVVQHREDLIRPASPHGQQHHSHPKTHCRNSIHEKRLTQTYRRLPESPEISNQLVPHRRCGPARDETGVLRFVFVLLNLHSCFLLEPGRDSTSGTEGESVHLQAQKICALARSQTAASNGNLRESRFAGGRDTRKGPVGRAQRLAKHVENGLICVEFGLLFVRLSSG